MTMYSIKKEYTAMKIRNPYIHDGVNPQFVQNVTNTTIFSPSMHII